MKQTLKHKLQGVLFVGICMVGITGYALISQGCEIATAASNRIYLQDSGGDELAVGITNTDGTETILLPGEDPTAGYIVETDGSGNWSYAELVLYWQRNGTVLSPANAGDTVELDQLSTTGNALLVERDLAKASTDSPVAFVHQENAGDDQAALYALQESTEVGETIAILGEHTSDGTGVKGLAVGGIAVFGVDTTGFGVYGGASTGVAVRGEATGSGIGVQGTSSTGYGGDFDQVKIDNYTDHDEIASPATPNSGDVRGPYALVDGNLYQKDDAGLETRLNYTQVAAPVVLSYTVDKPERFSDIHIHGFFELIATGKLDSLSPLIATNGISKLFFNVVAGGDTTGTITITGTSIDRDTGNGTLFDNEVITVAGTTTDNSSTDTGGFTVWGFANGYLSSKWWSGAVTLTTTNLIIEPVEVYNIAFEQFNDSPDIVVETFDITAESLSANAELYSHLYTVVPGASSTCVITSIADIEQPVTVAGTAYRLRRGALAVALDGTTDGIFAEMFLERSAQADWANINAKVWASCIRDLE